VKAGDAKLQGLRTFARRWQPVAKWISRFAWCAGY